MALCKKLYILLLIKIYIICLNQTDLSYINNQDISIKNAVYIIRNRDGSLNLDYKSKTSFINNEKIALKQNFEIKKDTKDEKEEYFYIFENNFDLYLSSSDHEEVKFNKYSFFGDKDYLLWKISPKINEEKKLIYYVQNKKNKKFWEFVPNKIIGNFRLSDTTEISNLKQDNEFLFIELYKNVEKKNSNLLNEEPIDVFIKYIDLTDRKLNRSGIKQIKKDEDNQELRYSVRSILKNIPWIRKIFILMPNKKVKYFKPIKEIKEKIVYVKDKDLLGFDTASIYAFLYNLYKMKKFGLSENFILMDDDYFIGQPLKKEDFFYEDNGKILPALVTSDYYEMNKEKLKDKLQNNLSKRSSVDAHSEIGFYVQQTRALLFMYDIFGEDDIRYGKKLIEPAFTHNAIPVKMSDIEELHEYILNKYEFGQQFLTSLIRTTLDLQMHTAYMAYVKNKYDRKLAKISSSFYDLSQIAQLKWNKKKLFVINTSTKNYRSYYYNREKTILEEMFPQKTKYELNKEEEKKQNEKDEEEEEEKEENKEDNNKNNKDANLLNISLININLKNVKGSNKMKSLENIENLRKDISVLFKGIKKIINTYEHIDNNDTLYKDILNEAKKHLDKQCKWQNKLNYFFIILFLLFVLNKIYNYTKIKRSRRNKYISLRREQF